MNDFQNLPSLNNEAIDSPVWLERLVDGEIGADQQRQLLLSLESQPDGWRRCALKFIEAQTLRNDLRGVEGQSVVGDDEEQRARPSQASIAAKRFAVHRVRWLAMAACFVLAFSIGTLTRGLWTNNAARNSTGPDSPEKLVAMNSGGNHSNVPTAAVGVNTGNIAASDATAPASQSVQVMVPTADGKSEQAVDVPLVAGSESDWRTMLAQQKPVFSEAELKTLESTGHLVEQRRAFYPVQLQDGRQAVVPVDLVEVRNTGGWQ